MERTAVTPVLLDTHVVIWLTEESRRLGRKARRLADRALARDAIAVSAISFWEAAMLLQRGRIEITGSPEAWRRAVLDLGVEEIPVSGEIGILAAMLPSDFPQDPADRIIAATASIHGTTLLTADDRLLDWPGRLARCDARS